MRSRLNTLATILRREIRKTGKTGFDIGVAAGVPPSTVTEFLRGKDIRLKTADKLAHYLGIRFELARKRKTKSARKPPAREAPE